MAKPVWCALESVTAVTLGRFAIKMLPSLLISRSFLNRRL
jgi:hypothetical protein